jgi:hypothetical protein
MTNLVADHPTLEVAYWVSQVIGASIQFVLIFVAIWAGVAAYRQANAFKLFELLKYTQDEKFRETRRTVSGKLDRIWIRNGGASPG